MTRFDDIQGRLAAATPGPWRLLPTYASDLRDVASNSELRAQVNDLMGAVPAAKWTEKVAYEVLTHDAEFIAHCPDDVRWLLDRVTQLETALTQIAERKHGTVTTSASGPVFVDGEELSAVYVRGQLPEEIARAALDTEQT